jgi:hypothetical protein
MTDQTTFKPAEVTRTTVRDVLAAELLAAFGIAVQDDQEMIADVFLERLWPVIEAWGAEQPLCVWGESNGYADCGGIAQPEGNGFQRRIMCEIHRDEMLAGRGPNWLQDH